MKKNIFKITIILFLTVNIKLHSTHNDTFKTLIKRDEFFMGFNANGILGQLVPFNRVNTITSDPSIMLRNYYGKYGFRAGFGFLADIESRQSLAFNFNIGYCKRLYLQKKWVYHTSLEFKANVANETITLTSTVPSFVGIRRSWGVEYRFNETVSAYTETGLQLSVFTDNNRSIIELNPPMSIFLFFKFR